jgi:hypothetical protein
MRRVATTLAVLVAAMIVAVSALLSVFGAQVALDEGRALYSHRDWLALQLDRIRSADVVWLGDSTIMSLARYQSYPKLFNERVLAPRGRRSVVVAVPGLDFFGYYALMGTAIATRPQLVVMIAKLRLLDPRGIAARGDLVSFVPASELPRLFTLPYASRSMTAPGLLLARLLPVDPFARATFLFDGARRRAADAGWWAALGPLLPELPE